MSATEVADARGRSPAMAAFMSLSIFGVTGTRERLEMQELVSMPFRRIENWLLWDFLGAAPEAPARGSRGVTAEFALAPDPMGNEFYIRSSRTKDRKSQFESERVRSITHRLDHRDAGRRRRLRRVSARIIVAGRASSSWL